MRIRIELERVDIDAARLCARVKNDKALWTFAAAQWHRLYKPYVPFKTGTLYNTVVITPGQIEHTEEYAHYVYMGEVYGTNRQILEDGRIVGYNSQKGRKKYPTGRAMKYTHPKASKKWDQAAAPTQLPKLVSTLQKYIDSGRLKL